MNVKLASRYIGPCHNTILVSPKKLFFYTKIKKKGEKRFKNKKYRKTNDLVGKSRQKGIYMYK